MAWQERQLVNIPLVGTCVFIGTALLVVVLLFTEAFFNFEMRREQNAKWQGSIMLPQLSGAVANQEKALSEYSWVDRDNKVAAIPIEQAMRKLAETGGVVPSTQPSSASAR
jgi:hypothetical protein